LTPLEIGGLTLFILVLLFGAYSVLFGLPGTVIILIDAALYAAATGFERIGFKVLLTLLILSILAELADFAVGMAGAVKFGASRKAFFASVIGGLIGAALLAPFLLGLGAIAGGFLGAFTGILIVELLNRNRLKPTLRVAWGALLGRAAGICVKEVFALIMVVITLTGIYN
jgi:uncharacterized protein YqgC (DUF456 family)